MKRIIALVLSVIMLCSLFTGCAKPEAEEEAYVPTGDALLKDGQDQEEYLGVEEKVQEFSLAYNSDRSMNPLIGYSFNNRVLFSLMYQPLFAVSSNYEAVPILCSAFQVAPSNMIYTCYIEDNARFSDGSAVTTEDVIASYEAAKAGSYYAGRFQHITSITAEAGVLIFELDTNIEYAARISEILKNSEGKSYGFGEQNSEN